LENSPAPKPWAWDETLYLGSAPHYARGRLPYAPGLPALLAEPLNLDGHGRLLDVGCGPGILTLLLAPYFDEAIGVDPDQAMLTTAALRASDAGIENVGWVRARGEDLPADLGTFRIASFAQSFHWMDRPKVAEIVFAMVEPGGAFVHLSDVKEAPAAAPGSLPYPQPPFDAIRDLLRQYLGPVRRAGQGVLPHGTPGDEATVLRSAGFEVPQRLRASAGPALERSVDDIVAWVYSLSSSAPHLFGGEVEEFETKLRGLLNNAAPSGIFSEQPPDTEIFIWRKPLEST
jgi:SAM-dependent methyltransferase